MNKLSLCNIENIFVVVNSIIMGKVPSGTYNISDSKSYNYQDIIDLKKPKFILIIPKFLILLAYYFGNLINNTFIKENSLKLYKDNVFPSKKIQQHISLPFSLSNLKNE